MLSLQFYSNNGNAILLQIKARQDNSPAVDNICQLCCSKKVSLIDLEPKESTRLKRAQVRAYTAYVHMGLGFIPCRHIVTTLSLEGLKNRT